MEKRCCAGGSASSSGCKALTRGCARPGFVRIYFLELSPLAYDDSCSDGQAHIALAPKLLPPFPHAAANPYVDLLRQTRFSPSCHPSSATRPGARLPTPSTSTGTGSTPSTSESASARSSRPRSSLPESTRTSFPGSPVAPAAALPLRRLEVRMLTTMSLPVALAPALT